jgi:hypothetical protein
MYIHTPSIIRKWNKESHRIDIQFEWGIQYIVEGTERSRLASHGLHALVILSAMTAKPNS